MSKDRVLTNFWFSSYLVQMIFAFLLESESISQGQHVVLPGYIVCCFSLTQGKQKELEKAKPNKNKKGKEKTKKEGNICDW